MVSKKAKKLQRMKQAPKELPLLADIANKHHHHVCKRWKGLLDHARQAGEALNKARYYCSHGTWQKWVSDNFDGSYETVQVYRRIAKEWDDRRLIQARKSGMELDSIKKVLDVLKGSEPSKIPKYLLNEDGTLNMKKAEEQELRKNILDLFAVSIKRLCKSELVVFEECFEDIWISFYEKILYPAACDVLQIDLHEAVVERWKALTRTQQKQQKPLKKMSRRDVIRMAEKAAMEDLRPPNILYRMEKVKEQKEWEKEWRKRKRRMGSKSKRNNKRSKTS